MRTVGVDMAVQPKNTAAAVIEWSRDGAVAKSPRLNRENEDLVELLASLAPGERAGIDCPFGWPTAFVAAVSAHAGHEPWPGDMGQDGYYRSLRLRKTDLVVDELVRPLAKRGPLSVSMDKLGATAARWAFLAHQLAETGHPVDRTGAGQIAEVYPAGACAMWGLEESHSLKALRDKAPWLGFEPGAEEGYANEHAFDALICALIARAITLGLTAPPRHDDERALAAVEGWIHLPGPDTLHALAPSAA